MSISTLAASRFVVYTGYPQVGEACRRSIIVQKPAEGAMLIDTLNSLFDSSPSSLGGRSSCGQRLAPQLSAAGAFFYADFPRLVI